jgi:hypothetical protein
MRKSNLFWGMMLVLGGVVLLLNTTGILKFNVWSVLFPLFLVALGLWFLVGPMIFKNEKLVTQTIHIPLEGATSAKVKLEHGAGRINLNAMGLETGNLLEGTFTGGVEQQVERSGSHLKAKLKVDAGIVFGVPTVNMQGLEWKLNLSRSLPVELVVETGASESLLDLHDLRVSELEIKTGASRTEVNLPAAAGFTKVSVTAGAAEVVLNVPEGVAASIKLDTGLNSKNINLSRFPQGGVGYESPDYATAANKVLIHVEAGVGSISIQ